MQVPYLCDLLLSTTFNFSQWCLLQTFPDFRWQKARMAYHSEVVVFTIFICAAAQRHKKHQFAPYVPKQMTQEELAIQTVSFGSQGAR